MAIVALLTIVSMGTLTACDLFGGNGGNKGSDINGAQFNEESTPQDVLDAVASGKIKNYTLTLSVDQRIAYCYYSPNMCAIEEYQISKGEKQQYNCVYIIFDEQANMTYEIEESLTYKGVYKYRDSDRSSWNEFVKRYFRNYLGEYTFVEVLGTSKMAWSCNWRGTVFHCELYDINNTTVVLPSKYNDYKEIAVG